MKTKTAILLATVALAFAAFSYTTFAQTTDGTTTTPPANAKGTGERHPAIRAAIAALGRAKTEMQNAKHDFGGHRAAALAECDKAIQQLQLALQYANAPATSTSTP